MRFDLHGGRKHLRHPWYVVAAACALRRAFYVIDRQTEGHSHHVKPPPALRVGGRLMTSDREINYTYKSSVLRHYWLFIRCIQRMKNSAPRVTLSFIPVLVSLLQLSPFCSCNLLGDLRGGLRLTYVFVVSTEKGKKG